MRALKIDNLRMKILVERDGDSGPLNLDSIDENSLILKERISEADFLSIRGIKLLLQVGGRWREYQLGNLTPEFLDEKIKSIKFKLENSNERDFTNDLSLARC